MKHVALCVMYYCSILSNVSFQHLHLMTHQCQCFLGGDCQEGESCFSKSFSNSSCYCLQPRPASVIYFNFLPWRSSVGFFLFFKGIRVKQTGDGGALNWLKGFGEKQTSWQNCGLSCLYPVHLSSSSFLPWGRSRSRWELGTSACSFSWCRRWFSQSGPSRWGRWKTAGQRTEDFF